MPELPEAETIVRGLRRRVTGRRIAGLEVVHADVLSSPPQVFRGCVQGRRITAIGRRGKNVVLELTRGRVVVVNLGMTGRLLPVEAGAAPPADATHPAVRFPFEDGGHLLFDDTRRFGALYCLGTEAWAERSARMGPEPLDDGFTAAALHQGLSRSRSPVRSWLLDQRRIAGVGNIYANEALHGAGIDPRRPACSLGPGEAEGLHRALREVLRRAIEARGTTLRDYRDAEGAGGAFGRRLAVYGRAGEPCPRCKEPVVRVVFGNRSAFLCPRCQPSDPGTGAGRGSPDPK